MAKRKIDAKEAVHYIRLGLDDYALMARYNLSAQGLQSLFRKLVVAGAISQAELDARSYLSATIPIPVDEEEEVLEEAQAPKEARLPQQVVEIIRDVRAGMGDSDLMTKYQLSSRGLQRLFEKLMAAKLITQADLDKRVTTMEATVDLMWLIKELGMDKHGANPEPKTSPVFTCPACGAPQTIDFEECAECGVNIPQFKKMQELKRREAQAKWKCPACGRTWEKDHDECPICGVIVSKLK